MEEKFVLNKIGSHPNRLGVLVCTHGDETLGFNVMKMIENVVDNITFVLMNKKAFDLGKRYVEYDLNRGFLGNERGEGLDSYEYMLSQELHKILSGFDNIIDIHSTNFPIEPYFIINAANKKDSVMLKSVSNDLIKNAYLIPLSKGTVIGSYPNAIAIESGPNNDDDTISQVASIVTSISHNMKSVYDYQKKLHIFDGELTKQDVFTLRADINDFELIPQGSILGYDENGVIILASEDMKLFWVHNNFGDDNLVAIKLKVF